MTAEDEAWAIVQEEARMMAEQESLWQNEFIDQLQDEMEILKREEEELNWKATVASRLESEMAARAQTQHAREHDVIKDTSQLDLLDAGHETDLSSQELTAPVEDRSGKETVMEAAYFTKTGIMQDNTAEDKNDIRHT